MKLGSIKKTVAVFFVVLMSFVFVGAAVEAAVEDEVEKSEMCVTWGVNPYAVTACW